MAQAWNDLCHCCELDVPDTGSPSSEVGQWGIHSSVILTALLVWEGFCLRLWEFYSLCVILVHILTPRIRNSAFSLLFLFSGGRVDSSLPPCFIGVSACIQNSQFKEFFLLFLGGFLIQLEAGKAFFAHWWEQTAWPKYTYPDDCSFWLRCADEYTWDEENYPKPICGWARVGATVILGDLSW